METKCIQNHRTAWGAELHNRQVSTKGYLMETARTGEDAAGHKRTNRIFRTEEGWSLRTREGIAVGPYATEFDAQLAASLLSPMLAQRESDDAIVAIIRAFVRDPGYGPNAGKRASVAGALEKARALKSPNGHGRVESIVSVTDATFRNLKAGAERVLAAGRARVSALAINRMQRELRSKST